MRTFSLAGAVPAFVLLVAAAGELSAQQVPASQYSPPDDIAFRTAAVVSNGARVHAEVFALRDLDGERLPTIIQAHGWGGTAAILRNDAIDFARAGYRVVNFDYRGWGQSDARVVLEAGGGGGDPTLRRIEGVVDPLAQVEDWFNVIHWAVAEPAVDPDRIGIRGTSQSGGHVIHVAAWEPRVRAVVSQVAATDGYTSSPAAIAEARMEATRRARGEIGFPEPFLQEGGLTGAPIQESFLRYDPNAVAHRVQAATRFIVVEQEELFNNEAHSRVAYDRIPGPKDYVVIPDITHYAIYGQARGQAISLALDWFDRFLASDGALR